MTLDYTDNTALRAALTETEGQLAAARDALAAAQTAVKENDSIKAQKPLDETLKRSTSNLRILTNQRNSLMNAIDSNERYEDDELAPHPMGESVGFDSGEIYFTDYGRTEQSVTIDAERAAKLVAVLTEHYSL